MTTLRAAFPRLVLALLVTAVAVWLAFDRDRLDPSLIETVIHDLGFWAPLGHIVLFALGTILFVPGAIFGLAGGALFGPLWGTVFNLAGATLGATTAFLVARYLAADWVRRKASGRLDRLITGVEAEGWRFVAFVRLVPLFPFNLTNYALGLTRISLQHYVLASLVCMVPGTVAYTWLGYAGREAAGGNTAAIRYGLIALALLASIAFLPRLVRRLRGQGQPRWIEVDELAQRLKESPGITVIDVRGPDEFTGPLGHIADASNMPVDELPERIMEISALKNTPVVLVCRTDKRSTTAATLLRDAGFRDVGVLRGGMEQWNQKGLPIEARAYLEHT
ncbi:MAG TPA: VTT domain-containing protein [Stellaceae bacterium]|nr:VTT domain-containing protein [Stellaceae bacterium]